MLSNNILLSLYQRLFDAYGPQNWWPANSPFEVIVGAVLTQNTSWTNVEKAIINLKKNGILSLEAIHKLDHNSLAEVIRPSGYFNIKAKRLKHVCEWITLQGGMEALQSYPTDEFRKALLGVNGIGPETADDILLYAFDRPVFVIDTYTRRLLKKLTLIKGDEDYEVLRCGFETNLQADYQMYNQYHALIVRHAKEKCVSTTDCLHCKIETAVL
ncbi:MAG: endonuclease-3 related protein [Gammaproteobacteria bacterium]|jgi:endonuclease-3 related protein